MQGFWDKVYGYIIQYGFNLLSAIVIFVVGKWVARMVAQLTERAMANTKLNATLASFTKNIVYYAILIFVAIAALNNLGVQTTSFVALIGAAGFAVGLALQGSLANFAAGVLVILFQYFEVGDTVEAGGACGKVTEIQVFNTILLTEDGKRVIVPNAKITGDKIIIHHHIQKATGSVKDNLA